MYDTTGIEGAGLFISVSLLLQCYYSVRRDRQAGGWLLHGRVFTWSVQGAWLFMGVSLLLQCTTRQASRGGTIHWRVFVTTVYDTIGIEGAGLIHGRLRMDSTGGGAIY